MPKPQIEVADVLRVYGEGFLRQGLVSHAKRRVMRELISCRTAQLGGHVEECTDCGERRISYNSCRNRHCPKCQGKARALWLESRQKDLLPVEYFHVVFTVPEEIAALALQNKRELYSLLFRASSEAMKILAFDPKRLGAEIGFISVLHTWGQSLTHHPHVHCVVPGGGLSPNGASWLPCQRGFFLPVRVLGSMFRKIFLKGVTHAYSEGTLQLQGHLESLKHPQAFKRYLATCWKKKWVVYAKPPFGGPHQVLKYLARYTHRVAIANSRILSMENAKVTFLYKDYRKGNKSGRMTLTAHEFIRRFLQHVLPKGFPRIRHFGFLANRSAKLARCRELLGPPKSKAIEEGANKVSPVDQSPTCPSCGSHSMIYYDLSPGEHKPPKPKFLDSS